MFGDPELTDADVAGAISDRFKREEQQTGQQGGLFDPSGAGSGNSMSTQAGQRPDPGQVSPATQEGVSDVSSGDRGLESDSRNAAPNQPVASTADGNARGRDAGAAGRPGTSARGERGTGQRDKRLSGQAMPPLLADTKQSAGISTRRGITAYARRYRKCWRPRKP